MAQAFVIFSAPRCNSTALYRALNLIPENRVAYEPAIQVIDNIQRCTSSTYDRVRALLSDYSGWKRMFDPTGYPFQSVHEASIEVMEQHRAFWVELNTVILNYLGLSIVFLRRRSGFQRIVSDLVGRATNVWRHSELPISHNYARRYKDVISKLTLPAIDEKLVRWYLKNLLLIEDQLRNVTKNRVLDVYYEDLFGPELGVLQRVERFVEVLKFLRMPIPGGLLDSAKLSLILGPSAQLNDASIFERIPNYRELYDKLALSEKTESWAAAGFPGGCGPHDQGCIQ